MVTQSGLNLSWYPSGDTVRTLSHQPKTDPFNPSSCFQQRPGGSRKPQKQDMKSTDFPNGLLPASDILLLHMEVLFCYHASKAIARLVCRMLFSAFLPMLEGAVSSRPLVMARETQLCTSHVLPHAQILGKD